MREPDVNDLAKVSKLFEALDTAGRKELLAAAVKQHFASGHVLCREGDDADTLYVLSKGQALVTVDDLGTAKPISMLTAGQVFGEQAMFSGVKRQATVTLSADAEVIAFPRGAVEAVLAKNPAAKAVLATIGLLRSEVTMSKLME
jgi:CRP-like cAMP-binding protein